MYTDIYYYTSFYFTTICGKTHRKGKIKLKVVGIVAEYNPFHNGHLFHITETKKKEQFDGVIVVMSGHFMQRGEPAIVDKWTRAKMALLGGADVVLELPYAFSCQSAKIFARGAVDILASTGIVTHICFGSESGDISSIKSVAKILCEEPQLYKNRFKDYLTKGFSFPEARRLAMEEYLKRASISDNDLISFKPNNILAVEYVKRIYEKNYNIIPMTIKRIGSDYYDTQLKKGFASATAIRKKIFDGKLKDISDGVPDFVYTILMEKQKEKRIFCNKVNLSRLILAAVRSKSPCYIKGIFDVREGIENRIYEASFKAKSYKELVDAVYTKRYTKTGIQRILAHIVNSFEKKEAQLFHQNGPAYIRVLGFNKKGRYLLSLIRKKASLPLITKGGIRSPGVAKKMISLENRVTSIWSLLLEDESCHHGRLEVISKPVML